MFQVKLHGPDYVGVDKATAEDDFNSRIENYGKVYDPMCTKLDGHCSFIKLINVGRSYGLKYHLLGLRIEGWHANMAGNHQWQY